MLAAAYDDGLCLLEFHDRRMLETQIKRVKKLLECEIVPGNHPVLKQTGEQLKDYFNGTLKQFTVPLVLMVSLDSRVMARDALARPWAMASSMGLG